MNNLELAPGVEEPLAFITQSTAILGKKGSGKTSAGVVLVEEVHRFGVPFVVIDPKGDWYGLRSAADGTPGIPVPILGGLHGDIPLEPTAAAGKYVADLLRGRRLSAVLDVSEFSGGERAKFLGTFADAFYRFDSKEPMLLVLEEAHEYIPQQSGPDEKRMLGNFERLVKQGRWKGLGVVMMTQRSASLNKNVLTQADNLFLMQTTSPQDRLAARGWIDSMADGRAKDVLNDLPSLQPGEAWVWQPGRSEPFMFRFRKRWTYDAGATPEVGVKALPAATLADVDLGAITAAMADTIEKAKADDPVELRRQLHLTRKELEGAHAEITRLRGEFEKVPPPQIDQVEVSVLTEEDRAYLSTQANLLHQAVLDLLRGGVADITSAADRIAAAAGTVTPVLVRVPPAVAKKIIAPAPSVRPVPAPRPVTVPAAEGDAPALSKAMRAILTVLVQYGDRSLSTIGTLTGYSSKGGGFNNAVGALRTAGYAEGGRDNLTITDAGRDAVGPVDPIPVSGADLRAHWVSRSTKAQKAILEALAAHYPNPVSRDELGAETEYEPTGGGFNNALGSLRSLGLITGDRAGLWIVEELV